MDEEFDHRGRYMSDDMFACEAQRCHRLADSITDPRTIDALRRLAREYELRNEH